MKKILLLLFLCFIMVGGYFGYLVFMPNNFSQPQIIKIESGTNAAKVAQVLRVKKMIKSEPAFVWYAKLIGADDDLVAGLHEIKPNSSIKSILQQLKTKTVTSEKEITIIEGWKLKDIAEYLTNEGIVSADDFLEAARIEKWRSKYDFLTDTKIKSLEGFVFPDTYRIFADATAADIIEKTLNNFENKMTGLMLSDIGKSRRSLREVIIMASIIEREALYDEDRAMIADIFWKRIEAGIGLQSDATVNYITGKKTIRPSYADLQIDSPYNTYKYRGLPPGPISNPGLASIKAAIYPTDNPYYYFLTDSDGRAHFGKTYAEHQANIQKYLK